MRNKARILKKYIEGQTVNIRRRDAEGEIIERDKVTIVKFYPRFVLCKRTPKEFYECFSYWELDMLTSIRMMEIE